MKAFAFALPWSRRTPRDESIDFAVPPAVFSSYQFSRTRFTEKKQQSWSGQAPRVLILTITTIETVNVTTRLDLGPWAKISCTTNKMIKFTPLHLQSMKTWNHLLSVHFLCSVSKRSSHCLFYWPLKKEGKNSQQVWHVVLWSTHHSQKYKHAGDATLQPRCNLSHRRFCYCQSLQEKQNCRASHPVLPPFPTSQKTSYFKFCCGTCLVLQDSRAPRLPHRLVVF